MSSCRKCGSYTKYHNGYCKTCYYGGNRVSGSGFFGRVFEGETVKAIENNPFSVMVIFFLFIIGFWFFMNPDGNKLTGILMMGVGVFWILIKNKRNIKNNKKKIKKTLLLLFVFALIFIIIFIIKFVEKYDFMTAEQVGEQQLKDSMYDTCFDVCYKTCKDNKPVNLPNGYTCQCSCGPDGIPDMFKPIINPKK